MTKITEVQDSYFTNVKRVEEPVVRFAERMADSVAEYVPERPSFLAELPTMTELVENQLKFRRRFVDEQAAFTRKMLKALRPVFVKLDAVEHEVAPAKVTKVSSTRSTKAKKAA